MAEFDTFATALAKAIDEEFGEDLTYSPTVGANYAIRGVWARSSSWPDVSPGAVPGLSVQASELTAAPVRGDQIVSGFDRWTVADIQEESGGYLLVVQKDA